MKLKHGISGGITFVVECKKCGTPVSARDKFCRGCGRKLHQISYGTITDKGELSIAPVDVIKMFDNARSKPQRKR